MTAGPFQDALDLRMLLFADDHDAVTVLCQPIRRFLRLLHMRAGGVYKPNRTFFRLFIHFRPDAVGSDDNRPSIRHFVDGIHGTDAFFFQAGDHLRIVDNRPQRRSVSALRAVARKPDCTFDAVTKAEIFRQNHFHKITTSPSLLQANLEYNINLPIFAMKIF